MISVYSSSKWLQKKISDCEKEKKGGGGARPSVYGFVGGKTSITWLCIVSFWLFVILPLYQLFPDFLS